MQSGPQATLSIDKQREHVVVPQALCPIETPEHAAGVVHDQEAAPLGRERDGAVGQQGTARQVILTGRVGSIGGERLKGAAAANEETEVTGADNEPLSVPTTAEKKMIGERVTCFDAAKGTKIWEHTYNVFHTDIVANRLGWAPLAGDAANKRVYVHSTGGFLFCFDAESGKILWERQLTEEFGRTTGYGGRVGGGPIFDLGALPDMPVAPPLPLPQLWYSVEDLLVYIELAPADGTVTQLVTSTIVNDPTIAGTVNSCSLTMLPGEGDQVRLLAPAGPEDPLAARAAELGRDAGKAAATWVFDGNTPDEAYRRVLRGIDDGDPAVLDAIEPPAIGPAAGYDQDDLARDLGIEPGDRGLPRAASAYADAFTSAFWQETERAARDHLG